MGTNIIEQTWKKDHSLILGINEVKLKDFQHRITKKILVTNAFLYRINKTDDNLCEYCRQQPDTFLICLCNTKKCSSKLLTVRYI